MIKKTQTIFCLSANLQKEGLKVQLSDEHEQAGINSGQTVVNCKVIPDITLSIMIAMIKIIKKPCLVRRQPFNR